jgi:hypothetical protein
MAISRLRPMPGRVDAPRHFRRPMHSRRAIYIVKNDSKILPHIPIPFLSAAGRH